MDIPPVAFGLPRLSQTQGLPHEPDAYSQIWRWRAGAAQGR